MTQVMPELMCPFGQMNQNKFDTALKSGKISKNGNTDDFELISGLVMAHYISKPMLATCCGVSACFTCIKDYVANQIRDR